MVMVAVVMCVHHHHHQRLLEYRNPMLALGLGESAGLSVANVQALREHCFIVETSSGDYHYFAADSDEERKEWKYAIKHRKAKSRSIAAAAADAATHGDDWVKPFVCVCLLSLRAGCH
jgi:hypothetical protein